MDLHWAIADISLWSFGLPPPVGLAIVVAIGYWITWRQRIHREAINNTRHDLNHARRIVKELESIARGVRGRITRHHADIVSFKHRLEKLGESADGLVGREVCDEADRLLRSMLPLASDVAQAYYEIRRQTNLLMQISETRIDALTGVCNRRALDDDLAALLARYALHGDKFSIILLDIDYFKKLNDEQGHLHGDKVLHQVARQIAINVDEGHIVARYGGEEFMVLLPESELRPTLAIAERIRKAIEDKLSLTISGGVAEVQRGDDALSLISRADEALYQAKEQGRNLICFHIGGHVERESKARS
ncbi:MAG: GGDEF domain-containing protein [Pirellulales bacterium]